ncbi:heterokaryon incompatibility protein het-E-1 [Fusarium pseudoanthophilum]|uniref:Heterokaryon incompatibility protein het-E-1 n=1 Tax=Fusarium pseudoanthophilum TaxID=48495 RepID=A0A8H5LAZ6_9HYPO|nr:heterokaryon incompatibility protein het-E-1 [Fusarium pseudoanthophilum]
MGWLCNTPLPANMMQADPSKLGTYSSIDLGQAQALIFLFCSFFVLAVFISMADPLSISASIAGLVALADLVFRSGTKYVKSYRGAPTEVGNLIREVRSLSVILHNLSLVAFDLEETGPPETTAAVHEPRPVLQPHYLHDCHQLLRRLETGLSRTEASLDSGSGRSRLQARLKWPYTSTESREMIQDIQRYNQIILTALAADSLAKLKHCLSRQVEMNDGLERVNRTAEKILDIQVKIALNAKRNQVLKDFGQVNPRIEYETNNSLRHDLTGLWLTQGPEFDYWYSTPTSRLWCSGIPGAGKSVLSAAVIKECLQRNAHDAHKATAYFFCTYRHERSQHLVNILSSLCIQLALQNENAFHILEEYHGQLFSSHHLSTKPTAEMLSQILHRICACFTRVYIILDGIDECDNRVEANVKCLAELALSQVDDVINMALFSRDESIIRTRLEKDFPHVEIEAHTEDLQLYVASELNERIASKRLRLRDPNLKDLIMTRLVGEAKGIARREALSKLPPSLYATYDRILLRIDGCNDAVKRIVKGALLMLATSFSSLCLGEICEAISLEDGATTLEDDEIVEEEELLRWCSSLVRVDKSGSFVYGKRIQFAHFTVQEYLQSLKTRNSDHQYPKLREYAVSRVDGIDFFSFLCLRFLTMEKMERFPPTPDITRRIRDMLARRRRRTFYCKSVLTWTPHTIPPSKMGHGTHRLLRKLFQPSKTPSFCLWAIDFMFRHHPSSSTDTFSDPTRILSKVVTAVLRPEFTPLHMAAAFTSETIISLTLSCPGLFINNVQVVIELLRAGVSITAQDVQLFRVRYDRCLQLPAFTSETSPMWSLFPQLLKILGENLTPGFPRFVLHQETADFILRASKIRQSQCPVGQSLDGASNQEILKYFHSLISLNDETGISAFLATPRAELAKSTDIDPERPGWNALHLALFEGSFRVLDPLLAFGLDPCAESPDGFKPVHMCCWENTYEALQILLRFGGSTLDTDSSGRTVWHLAAELNSVGKALGRGQVTRFFLDISGGFVFKSTTRLESLGAIIDQKDIRHQNRTPLFVAAAQNNVKAVNALLIHGADINTTDDRDCTPLFVAVEQGAMEVVELLIGRGAHIDAMNASSHGLFDMAFVQKSWEIVDTLLKAGLSSKRINVDGRNLLGLMTLWTCQPGTKPNIGLFKRLLDHGVDLYLCDKFGSSTFHYLLTRPCRSYLLCMLDMRLDLLVEKLNSWPDHFFSNGVDTLVDLTYSLRYVKPSIKIEGVRQLCGLGTPGAHSLLCRAACWGSVTAILNLIKLGISDLEHHCHEHGSPLNAAVQNHRWEAVKFLMLHGATVPEDLWRPKNSTPSTANPGFMIREWLFVGRHAERKRISLGLLNDEPEMKCWSGVWVVRVPLQWRDRKCSVESILEYAKRRRWLEIEYKSSAIRDVQLVRPKERCRSMSSVERQGYCGGCDGRSAPQD